MPSRKPMSASFSRTSDMVVSPKLRTSNNCSSVRVTRSRTVVMFSDSRQFVARTDNSNSAGSCPAWLGSLVDAHRSGGAGFAVDQRTEFAVLHEGFRCLRRILAASTNAISGDTEPFVQISIVSLS